VEQAKDQMEDQFEVKADQKHRELEQANHPWKNCSRCTAEDI